MNEESKEWFQYTLGDKSHLNIFGRVVFFIPAVLLWVGWIIVSFLFGKRQ